MAGSGLEELMNICWRYRGSDGWQWPGRANEHMLEL